MHAHLRIARPVSDLPRSVNMSKLGLSLEEIDSFEDHEGFDGVMLGVSGAGFHFEFIVCAFATAPIVLAACPATASGSNQALLGLTSASDQVRIASRYPRLTVSSRTVSSASGSISSTPSSQACFQFGSCCSILQAIARRFKRWVSGPSASSRLGSTVRAQLSNAGPRRFLGPRVSRGQACSGSPDQSLLTQLS